MQACIAGFLKHMESEGRFETIRCYQSALSQYNEWTLKQGIDPLKATVEDIRGFQVWLSEECRSKKNGKPLGRMTQHQRLCVIRSLYQWFERRGLVLVDVSQKVKLPKVNKNVTRRDYLTLQEATALLQTQARRVSTFREGCYSWARAFETLAFLCVAIATGRRRTGLRNLLVDNLNFERNELRCEREKGKSGRVLPVAAWAMNIVKTYVNKARPVLDWQEGNEFLFVGDTAPRIGKGTIDYMLEDVHKRTVDENPDLTELAAKRITPHSLRVSFAKLLFNGGCNIRSVNELMMHTNLTTTAYYTPIPLEDMRRVCRLAHPRA